MRTRRPAAAVIKTMSPSLLRGASSRFRICGPMTPCAGEVLQVSKPIHDTSQGVFLNKNHVDQAKKRNYS